MRNDEEKARSSYNSQREVYGQGSIAEMNVELPEFANILQEYGLFQGSVIDVGVGTGQLTNFLLQNFPNANVDVHGFDISEENVDQFNTFKQKHERIVDGKVASLYDTEYKKNKFDLAVSNHVLHYAEDLTSALQEVRRILKEGSYFVFSSVVSEKADGQHIIRGVLTHEKIDEPIKVWAFQRSKEEILKAFNEAGFALMPFDNASFFKEFWPEYYYYRPENPNVSIGNPHTFVAVAQALPRSADINQVVENEFRKAEFKRQTNRIINLLYDWGYEVENKDMVAAPDYHETLDEARGGFNESKFVFSNSTTIEDKFFFLLHGLGHIAQWRQEPNQKERSLEFEHTLKQKKNLKEHYEHEINSLKYSLDFMLRNGLEEYTKWFMKYFLADQEYISNYVMEERSDVGFAHFSSILNNFEVLEISQNNARAVLRKNIPSDMSARQDESDSDFFIYLI